MEQGLHNAAAKQLLETSSAADETLEPSFERMLMDLASWEVHQDDDDFELLSAHADSDASSVDVVADILDRTQHCCVRILQ